MTMRFAGVLFMIALAACSPRPAGEGGETVVRPPTNEPQPPAPGEGAAPLPDEPANVAAVPGFEPAVVALLGLDGPAAPKAVDGAATARFAVRYRDENVNNAIAIYDVAGGAMTKTRAVVLKQDETVHSWVWRDHQELVILLHDGELRSFSGPSLAPIKRPAKKLFKAKKPDPSVERFDRDEGLRVGDDGAVTLRHCVWGYTGDDDPCVTEIEVPVLPALKSKAGPTPLAAHPAPPGHRYGVVKQSDLDTGELECTAPSGATKLPVPADSLGYSADDVEWISAQPPIARVNLWYAGLDDASATPRFFAGCATTPTEVEHGQVVRGPGWYWAQLGLEHASVLWHGKVVGSLAADDLAFAP
jgi:hypothetical protein